MHKCTHVNIQVNKQMKLNFKKKPVSLLNVAEPSVLMGLGPHPRVARCLSRKDLVCPLVDRVLA